MDETRTALPGPARPVTHEALRYLIVGGCGFVLAMALYAVLLAVGVSPYVALPPVFVANGLFNFFVNRLWSFGPTDRGVHTELGRFAVVAGVSLVVNYLALYVAHDVAGIAALPAQAIAIAVATPVGFLGNKHWSFAAAEEQPA